MNGLEHTYRYPTASQVSALSGQSGIYLATETQGTTSEAFFEGRLTHPFLTAQLLGALARVVGSRFHVPPAMLGRILAQSDPVVTSGGGLLRFEGLSGCCSVYARVDMAPESYRGEVVRHGTTNVDFNPEMRAALAQIRDSQRVAFSVGGEQLVLRSSGQEVVERKVKLPLRWLKAFVEVQHYQGRLEPRLRLGRVELMRLLRALPRATTRGNFWFVPLRGGGVRLSPRAAAEGVKLAGLERLRILESLAPHADGLTVFADPTGEASEWRLGFGPLSFSLTLSADVWRGFSGEGQALSALTQGASDADVAALRAQLHWQALLTPEQLRTTSGLDEARLMPALARLGALGLLGFDTAHAAWFHRRLPFDLGQVEALHPRLDAAQRLLREGGVTLRQTSTEWIEGDVRGSGVLHRVRLGAEQAECDCLWYAQHQLRRGPCKHILALQLFMEEGEGR